MERYICVHGHFYQPPRENPWLEAVELQDSAYPYHDWNQRITAECYAPNTASRILDGEGRIVKIVNNYARISFNFGPTLLAWLEQHDPTVYQAILAADKEAQRVFGGHGAAIAQVYNHMIMPLANQRDRYTQVRWGIADFKHRFGRAPEGMWLAEAAVNTATLEVLAESGIRFTILSPYQARRVRRSGSRSWLEVSNGRIDPRQPYKVKLPSGRAIAVFFYLGPTSQSIAFQGILDSGEVLAEALCREFNEGVEGPQLVHIATDGETYGHHHKKGDMALAFALAHIEQHQQAHITNYGQFLELCPPRHEVEIFQDTSWSCGHGIERWRANCGCNSGRAGWHQEWRAPLREALDWLRDTLAPLYEREARLLLKDPWKARDDYVQVLLARSPDNTDAFLQRHQAIGLGHNDKVAALTLLEMQRHALLMYTSCGWFFDELSGIETVQVIQYAARAIQLAEWISGQQIEAGFLERIALARSNLAEHGDGRQIYEKFVRPARLGLKRVGAHYAVSAPFEEYAQGTSVFCYTVERERYKTMQAGKARLAVGEILVSSQITRQQRSLTFGVLHFGDHNLNCGVRDAGFNADYELLEREAAEAFARSDFAETVRVLDRHFGQLPYSLKSLFRDEQRRILDIILATTLGEAEAMYRTVYENHSMLLRFLKDLEIPLAPALHTAAEFTINTNLKNACAAEDLDLGHVAMLLAEAKADRVDLDAVGLGYTLQGTIERLMDRLSQDPADMALLGKVDGAVGLVELLPFEVRLWKVRNDYYTILEQVFPEQVQKAEAGEEAAKAWLGPFRKLGDRLRIRVA